MFLKKLIREVIYRLRGDYTTEKLKRMGLKVGKNFKRLNDVIIDPSHCWLISIGDNVTLAPRVHILSHDASTKNLLGYTKIGCVDISNNVFIGAGSIVLPNIKIGENVIIAAGSIVTKNLPSNCVYGGNPAKFICKLDEYLEKNRELMKHRPCYNEEFTLRKNISAYKKSKMYSELQDGLGYVE